VFLENEDLSERKEKSVKLENQVNQDSRDEMETKEKLDYQYVNLFLLKNLSGFRSSLSLFNLLCLICFIIFV